MTTQTDALVLGGGPAGYVASLRAAQFGAQVVLIEEEKIGGVRPDVSSIPTRALLPSAEVYRVFHVLRKPLPVPQEREGR